VAVALFVVVSGGAYLKDGIDQAREVLRGNSGG
jgi:hypothetical protein